MASTVKHLRSSTASKRPTASGLSDGQLGINTASGTPGVFFKNSAGTVTKVGPAHVGSTAPNATPAGSAGNSLGELWVDNSTTINGLNYFTGSAFVNLTPSGTTTVAGLVELATDAETQTGTDTIRAVTPSGLQSKVSNSISTTSSTTIASATAVKTAYDLANAALPKSGGRVTGELEIGPAGSLVFEGSTDDGFETTIAVVNPTADRTVTFPNVTGTVVTTGDTGSVTSAMILDGTIVNADINASAAIVDTKLATISTAGKVNNSATTATSANTNSAIVARDGSGNFSAGTITANLTGTASAIADNTVTSAKIVDGAIVNADVNASAAIAGTKVAPNFGSQTITTTGVISPALGTAALPSVAFTGDTNTGIYSPGADQVAISTNGTERLSIGASGDVNIDSGTLYVDATNNRVGVGTTSPNTYGGSLNVIGATVGGESTIVVSNTNTSQFARFGINADVAEIAWDNADALAFGIADSSTTNGLTSEYARIDSSGRLLVGTSSQYESRAYTGFSVTPVFQVHATNISGSSPGFFNWSSSASSSSTLTFNKSKSNTVGTRGIVANNDDLGEVGFLGDDGTNFIPAAGIRGEVDGTPGTNDMPGRLVFSTTADGASSPTEGLRLTNDNVIAYNQAAPATVNTSATITAANLKTGIITSTTAAAVTMTLPTGTNIELGFSGIYTNMAFEFSVINTGPNALTVGANGNTTVGSLTVATLTSARYALRRTGANAFTLYRLS